MRFRVLSLVTLGGVLVAGPGDVAAAEGGTTRSVHGDRGTPRLQLFSPEQMKAQSMAPEAADESAQKVPQQLKTAWLFLSEHAADYGLTPDLSNLELVETSPTLLGMTFRFKQLLGGRKVGDGEIVLSVNDQGQVYQVYNNIYPVPANKAARAAEAQVSQDKALEVAWAALGAQGFRDEKPVVELKYVPTAGGDFVLAYDVRLFVDRKTTGGETRTGLWRVLVDAVDGKVIDQPVELTIYEGKRAGDQAYVEQPANLSAAIAVLRGRQDERRAAALDVAKQTISGQGLVFDPEPVTTLKDASLEDGSPTGKFDPAYVEVILPDLTKRNGAVFLESPWVRIDDFEPPATPPSSTPDGVWRAKRGSNAFNDVMTYYHIDRSQRYLQSLGYAGARGIQALPIAVDSDGVNGADNSHYVPSSNRLAFGHGCVDDNEDVDVILHEYGHALTHGINPSWGGGDSGAIGEGFGDYWAETYSFTTANGPSFQPEKVFDWDGTDDCWPGRRLNVTGPKYDPNRTYRAHQLIGGDVQSDELWSTPLYQSFVELRGKGVPREEVDKVVIESMFGLGSGFTMRDLATKTVGTAAALFSAGPHAGVFEGNFRKLDILPDGQPSASAGAASGDVPVSKK
jgi:zinc metalloprotease ZmpB